MLLSLAGEVLGIFHREPTLADYQYPNLVHAGKGFSQIQHEMG